MKSISYHKDAEFVEKVKSDLKINDLTTDNINNIAFQHYYYQLYVDAKWQMMKAELLMDSLYKDLYHYYKFEYNHELRAQEIELYCKADPKMKQAKSIFIEKELNCEYLLEVVKMFKDRNWAIKNAIELSRLTL